MLSIVLGTASAAGASILYNGGIALQSLDARVTAAEERRLGLFLELARRRRWLAGTGLTMLGWPLQAAALLLAPLTVVQPALGVGLIVLLVVSSRRLDEPVGRREALAVAGLLAGVALIAAAAPAPAHGHAGAWSIGLALGVLGLGALLALVPVVRSGPTALALGAGTGFAASGVTTDLVAAAAHNRSWVDALAWAAATGAAAGIALLCETSALRLSAAARVAPVVFGVQVVIPVALAPWLVGEDWHHGLAGTAVVVSGVSLVVSAACALLGAAPTERAPRSGSTTRSNS